MSSFEVANPILSSPFAEPARHWYIREGEEPEQREGRRPATVLGRRTQATIAFREGRRLAAAVTFAQ